MCGAPWLDSTAEAGALMNTACHSPSPLCRSLTHHSPRWISKAWSKWALFYFSLPAACSAGRGSQRSVEASNPGSHWHLCPPPSSVCYNYLGSVQVKIRTKVNWQSYFHTFCEILTKLLGKTHFDTVCFSSQVFQVLKMTPACQIHLQVLQLQHNIIWIVCPVARQDFN